MDPKPASGDISGHATTRADNRTGITAMLFAMAAFAANDTCIKLIGETLPIGEVIALRSAVATVMLCLAAVVMGTLTLAPDAPGKLIAWRVGADLLATFAIVAAVIHLPLAEATAINQFTPLAMTAAAAIILKERVSIQLWVAALVGLFGVALIVRPGTEAFVPAAIFPLAGVVFVAARDIATRRIGKSVSTLTLAALCTAAATVGGLAFMPFENWLVPAARDVALIGVSGFLIMCAYVGIIIAMRHGDVATVSPFRYAVIVFAIIPGWLIWNKWPDNIQFLGIAILTAAGVYTFRHARKTAR